MKEDLPRGKSTPDRVFRVRQIPQARMGDRKADAVKRGQRRASKAPNTPVISDGLIYFRSEVEEPDVELGVVLLVPVVFEVPDVPVVEPVVPLLIEPDEPDVPVELVVPVALPDVPEVSELVEDGVVVAELLRVALLQPVTPNPARPSAARSVMVSRFVFMSL
jgi:hypothetical protein